jgi:uncharacterized membrane protein YgcG
MTSCLDSLALETFDLPAGGSDDRAMFKVWSGRLRFAGYQGKALGKPKIEILISPYMVEGIKMTLAKLESATPGTKYPITAFEYDRDSKQFRPKGSLVFIKDDKGVYQIQATSDGNTQTYLFMAPKSLAFGSEPMADRDRSALAVKAFLSWLEVKAVIQMVLTKRSDTGRNFGGGQGGNRPQGGGGGYNGGGQGGGGAPKAPDAPSDNDSFFA